MIKVVFIALIGHCISESVCTSNHATKDASCTIPGKVQSAEELLEKSIGDITLGPAIAVSSAKLVQHLSQKYREIFDTMVRAVNRSEELTKAVLEFSNTFRPVNTAALELVEEVNSQSKELADIFVPMFADMSSSEDFASMGDVAEQVRELFEPSIKTFNTVREKYQKTRQDSSVLVSTSLGLHRVAAAEAAHAEANRDTNWKVGVALGGAAVALTLTPLGAAFLTTVGFTAGTAGIATGGAAAAAGGGAVLAVGGGLLHGSTLLQQQHLVEVAEMITNVMLEIDKLMDAHEHQLIKLKQWCDDVDRNAKQLKKLVSDLAKISKTTRNAISRRVQLMEGTAKDLVSQTQQYFESEKEGQAKVQEVLRMVGPAKAKLGA